MRRTISSSFLLIIVILFGAFLVRLYRFNNPIADWHSWRQADTSAVSRNFAEYGYDILHPRFDDLSNVPSGIDNPNGYRFVEFPLYNIAQASLFQLFGWFSIEEWGRLVTIASSLFSLSFIYLLVSKYANKSAGLFSAFFYAFLPYNIYYGRVILPDPSMVAATLGAIYFFDQWLFLWTSKKKETKKEVLYGLLAFISCTAAFLLKPYAGFFLLPIVYIVFTAFGWSFWKKWQLYLFAILAITPLIAWRVWIAQFPEGIPASAWLLNGNGIRFKPSFFRWMGYERLTKLISGYAGVLLLLLGAYMTSKLKYWVFFTLFAVSSVLYICIFATGNVQHDYYQILIMPSIAIFYGLGAYYLFSVCKPKIVGRGLLIVITLVSFYFAWNQVKDYFNINNEAMVRTGKAIDKLIPKDAKVIAPLDGDTSFLYQTKRQGWPTFEKDLPVMVNQLGADYLVLVNPNPNDSIKTKYKVISQTKDYILVNLHEKP